MRILVQLAYAIVFLVAQVLRDSLSNRIFNHIAFALYDYYRDTIDKQYNVRAIMIVAGSAGYHKLFTYVKDVVLGAFPIDIPKRITFLATVNGLLKGFAQCKQVIHLLVYRHKPLVSTQFFKGYYSCIDILFRKSIVFPEVVNTVYLGELCLENRL